jgi:hypothetical protein
MTAAQRKLHNRIASEIAMTRTLAHLKRAQPELIRANKYLSAETADSLLKTENPAVKRDL